MGSRLKKAYFLLIRKDFREAYRTWWIPVFELLTIIITLTVYLLTSKALKMQIPGDYFQYLVLGESMLLLPLLLFESIGTATKRSSLDGTLDVFRSLPGPVQMPLILQALSILPRQFIRLCMLILFSVVLFGLKLHWAGFIFAFALELACIPLFLGLGCIAAALILWFGRGASLLSHVVSGAAILAGAYFPLTVFPEFLRDALVFVSPFTALLESVRSFCTTGFVASAEIRQGLVALGLWSLLAFPAGYFVLGYAVHRLRKINPIQTLTV